MDKHEFDEKVQQLKKLAKSDNYEMAMDIANTIDWRRVNSASLLSTVSEVYEKMNDYSEAKDILLLAYERLISGKHLLYRLTCLALKEGSIEEAEEYYKEFYNIAAEDSRVYILRYLILKAKDAPIEQMILALESYNNKELNEKWMYELAECYHNAGRSEDCIRVCDNIMLLFGLGKYVDKAIRLKTEKEGRELTAYQRGLVENREHYQNKLQEVANYYRENEFAYEADDDIDVSLKDSEETAQTEEPQLPSYAEVDYKNSLSIEERELVKKPSIHTDEILVKQVPIDKLIEVEDDEEEEALYNAGTEPSMGEHKHINMYDVGVKSISSEVPEEPIEDIDIEDIDILDSKAFAYIIEARTDEIGLEKAKEVLKYITELTSVKRGASKVPASKFNDLGIDAICKKAENKNLVIVEVGDLSDKAIDELSSAIGSSSGERAFVLIDNARQLAKLRKRAAKLFELCTVEALEIDDIEDENKAFDTKLYQPVEAKEQEVLDYASFDNINYNIKPHDDRNYKHITGGSYVAKEEEVTGTEAELDIALPSSSIAEPKAGRKRIKALGGDEDFDKNLEDNEEELDIDSFADYASDYAGDIDCVIMGQGMLALYERAEIMASEGVKLTRAEARAMIEEVADYAEKPPVLKKIFKFSPKYNKDGLLILKEEHFLP